MKEDSVARHPAAVYRRFKRNGNFDFMIFAYNAKLNEKGATDLAVQTQIYADNKLIVATPLKNFQSRSHQALCASRRIEQGFQIFALTPITFPQLVVQRIVSFEFRQESGARRFQDSKFGCQIESKII